MREVWEQFKKADSKKQKKFENKKPVTHSLIPCSTLCASCSHGSLFPGAPRMYGRTVETP